MMWKIVTQNGKVNWHPLFDRIHNKLTNTSLYHFLYRFHWYPEWIGMLPSINDTNWLLSLLCSSPNEIVENLSSSHNDNAALVLLNIYRKCIPADISKQLTESNAKSRIHYFLRWVPQLYKMKHKQKMW